MMGWRRSSERRNNATQPNYSGPEIPFPTRCAIPHNAQFGMRLLLLCLRQQGSGRRFLEAAAKVLLAHEFVFNQDLRRLVPGASGLNHLPDQQLSGQPLCEAANKLIITINQPA